MGQQGPDVKPEVREGMGNFWQLGKRLCLRAKPTCRELNWIDAFRELREGQKATPDPACGSLLKQDTARVLENQERDMPVWQFSFRPGRW